MLGIPKDDLPEFSNRWLQKFNEQNGLWSYKFHGKAGSVNTDNVKSAQGQLQVTLKDYSLCDVFNMDETGLFYQIPPKHGLAMSQMSGLKGDKTRITVAFTANVDGTEKRAPLKISHTPPLMLQEEGWEGPGV